MGLVGKGEDNISLDEAEEIEKKKDAMGGDTTYNLKIVKLKGGLQRIKFTIPEKDLSEKFIKGFGPGG